MAADQRFLLDAIEFIGTTCVASVKHRGALVRRVADLATHVSTKHTAGMHKDNSKTAGTVCLNISPPNLTAWRCTRTTYDPKHTL